MADSAVRQTVLKYLQQQPEDQSVQPDALAAAVGLAANQVVPSLTAAKKRGEVDSLADGSVRLSSKTRGSFRDGKPPLSSYLPDAIAVPFHVLNRAISQVPAVKYALGIAGIVAAAAIIYLLLANLQNPTVWVIAGLVVLAMLVFMVVLFVFAKLVESKSPQVHYSGMVLMWFSVLLFIAVCCLLFSSVFFSRPRNIKDYFSQSSNPVFQSAPPEFTTLPDTTVLPEEVFGAKNDATKPQQWDKYIVFGFKFEFHDPVTVYLVTEPFPDPAYGDFTLYVNVNTNETVDPLAFLSRLDGNQVILMPLRQADQRQGPRTEYRYSVPHDKRPKDRLVVILGMERTTHDGIKQDKKFVLTSQPLNQ